MIKIIICVDIAFFYREANILHRWSNILRNFYGNKHAAVGRRTRAEAPPNMHDPAQTQGNLGSGQRYMICVTLFCTLELHGFRVQFSHVRVFSDSSNVQKRDKN